MAFPWDVLIAGATTLGAGLGAARLQTHADLKREREQRRQDASFALLASLDELIRLFTAPETYSGEVRSTMGRAAAYAVGSVHHAAIPVRLAGSPAVRAAAGEARQAAWDIYDWFQSDSSATVDDLVRLVDRLKGASDALASAVEHEISTPPSRRRRTGPVSDTVPPGGSSRLPATPDTT